VSLSRRKFLATAATAGGAVLTSPGTFAAPYQVSVQRGAAQSVLLSAAFAFFHLALAAAIFTRAAALIFRLGVSV